MPSLSDQESLINRVLEVAQNIFKVPSFSQEDTYGCSYVAKFKIKEIWSSSRFFYSSSRLFYSSSSFFIQVQDLFIQVQDFFIQAQDFFIQVQDCYSSSSFFIQVQAFLFKFKQISFKDFRVFISGLFIYLVLIYNNLNFLNLHAFSQRKLSSCYFFIFVSKKNLFYFKTC